MFTKVFYLSLIFIVLVNLPTLSQDTLIPPDSLSASQLCDEINLTWVPPTQSLHTILGYNVYLEDSIIQFTQDTFTTIIMQGNGVVTFNVTTVYDAGESEPAGIAVELVIYAPATNLTYDKYQCTFIWNRPQGNVPSNVYPSLQTETLKWCDNYNFDGIGTGSEAEFDVAAVWSPQHLAQFGDGDLYLTKVSFFPTEELCDYTIRVWQGDYLNFPDELLYDQPVDDFINGAWNHVMLNDSILINVEKYLWVGYNVHTLDGYPAGVDDGPAFDHYGNMMYFNGTWQSLLEINPYLDYNWNIFSELVYSFVDNTLKYDIYGHWNCYYYQTWKKLNEEPLTDTTFFYACLNPSDDWLDNKCFVQVNYCNTPVNSDTVTCEICWFSGQAEQPTNPLDVIIFKDFKDFWLAESKKEILVLTVFDLSGRVIFQQQYPMKEVRIEKQKFSKGLYLLEVITKDGRSIKKIIR